MQFGVRVMRADLTHTPAQVSPQRCQIIHIDTIHSPPRRAACHNTEIFGISSRSVAERIVFFASICARTFYAVLFDLFIRKARNRFSQGQFIDAGQKYTYLIQKLCFLLGGFCEPQDSMGANIPRSFARLKTASMARGSDVNARCSSDICKSNDTCHPSALARFLNGDRRCVNFGQLRFQVEPVFGPTCVFARTPFVKPAGHRRDFWFVVRRIVAG